MKKNKQSNRNIKGKWFQSLLMSDFEQTDIQNLIKAKQSRKQFPLIESLIQKNEDLSDSGKYDALMSKITYEKYLLIRNTVAYLCLLSFIFSLTTFGLGYQLDHKNSTTNNILMIIGLVNKLCQVIVYLFSKQQYGNFLKAIGDLKPNQSYFAVEGYGVIAFKTIILAIQPLFFIKDVTLNLRESYWTGDSYIYFYRDINHYLYLVQFTVQFWLFFSILMENLKWASTRTHRICKMFGFFNGKIFIVKCLLATQGVTVAFVIVIAGLFFFATLINVSEIGLAMYLNPEDFESVEAYQEAFYGIAYLSYYFNSYWNMIITMTTIGYGDMWVNSTLSRIILFFVAVYGAVVFPVFVVTLTNFFELSGQDHTVHDIIGLLDLKNQMKKEAAHVITTLVKLRYADKKKDQAAVKSLSLKLMSYQAAFKTLKTQYNNIKAPDQIQDLSSKLEQLEQKFSLLERFFLPFMLKENPDFEEPEEDQLNDQILQKHEYEKIKERNLMKQNYRQGHLENAALKTNFHKQTNFGQTAGFAFGNKSISQSDKLKEMIKKKHEQLQKNSEDKPNVNKDLSKDDPLQKKIIDKINHQNRDKDLPSSEEDEMKKFLQENIKHSNLFKDLPSSEQERQKQQRENIKHNDLDKTLSLSQDEFDRPSNKNQSESFERLIDSQESSEEQDKIFKQRVIHNNLNKSFEIYDEEDSNTNLKQDKISLQDLYRSISQSSEENSVIPSKVLTDDLDNSIDSQKQRQSIISDNKKIIKQESNSTESKLSNKKIISESPDRSPIKNIEDKPIKNSIHSSQESQGKSIHSSQESPRKSITSNKRNSIQSSQRKSIHSSQESPRDSIISNKRNSSQESPRKSIKQQVPLNQSTNSDESDNSLEQKQIDTSLTESLKTTEQKQKLNIEEESQQSVNLSDDDISSVNLSDDQNQKKIQNHSLDISEDEEDVLNQSDSLKNNKSQEDLNKQIKRQSRLSLNKDDLNDKHLHDILINGGITEPLDNFSEDDQIKTQKKKKKIKNVYFIEINECEECNENNYLQHLVEN